MTGSTIAPLFDIGPRIAAQVLGSTYAQYRPSGASNPTAISNHIADLPVWVTADAGGKGTKPFSASKPIAYAMIDPALASAGDYLIGQFGTFFIASIDGLMPTQIVRCNQTVTVSRPGSQSPGAGYYGGVAVASQTTILTAWPASVIQGTKGEAGETKLPGDTRLAWAAIMLPPSGIQLLPGDWIVTNQAVPMTYTVSSCEFTPLGWRVSAASAVA